MHDGPALVVRARRAPVTARPGVTTVPARAATPTAATAAARAAFRSEAADDVGFGQDEEREVGL